MATKRTPKKPGQGPVPPAVVVAAKSILAKHGGGGPCARCGGAGYLEDHPTWVVVRGKRGTGKMCFRCEGSCVDPGARLPDPLVVRANVVQRLVPLVEAGAVVEITKLVRRYQTGPFWPVLVDAFDRAEQAAKTRRSAKVAANVSKRLQERQASRCREHGYLEPCGWCEANVDPPVMGMDPDDPDPPFRDWGDLD